MSMNLNARNGKDTIELWQTPTHISFMCCTNQYGKVVEMRGRNAKRALHMYLAWARSVINGSFASTENVEEQKRIVDDHEKYITTIIKGDTRKLCVWVM